MTLSKNLIPLVARELKERLKNLQLQDVTEICVDIPMQDDADGQITLWYFTDNNSCRLGFF